MKKWMVLLLALCMTLALTACGADKAAQPAATEALATEAPATVAPATEAPATEAPATEAPATEAPATEAPATEAPAEAPVEGAAFAEFPALVTSGGQSADYQMIGTMMGKLKMDYTMNNLATSADLGEARTLIVVVGGSSKGLGAAGIDAEAELARLTELIDAAKGAGLSVIAMHTGGTTRRGDLSDKFIAPVFERADYAIVASDGDGDGLMSGICAEKGIPIEMIASLAEVMTVLPAAFK